MMRRREFISLLGGAAAAWPLAARAQQGKRLRASACCCLEPLTPTRASVHFSEVCETWDTLESTEHRNRVSICGGKPDRLRSLAGELVAIKPDLIFALGGDVAPSARVATSTIPIVVAVSNDPVQAGLVASLARPGGNITGVTFVSSDLAAKRLQFLREIAPNLVRSAVIWNPDHVDPEYRETQDAAKTLGMQVQSLEVRGAEHFDSAFQTATNAGTQALIPIHHD